MGDERAIMVPRRVHSLNINRMSTPTLNDIRSAYARIQPHIHRTPVLTSQAIDDWCGAHLFFKCENLQKAGAFKMRGATNAVLLLSPEQAKRGVATHSSGNHAAALALAAQRRGVHAWIVMPNNAPPIKRDAVVGYGATIRTCEPTLAAREAALQEVVAETGAEFVPPYNDDRVIAGQGTAALELLQDVGVLDAVVAPVGGGGLLAGTAIAVTSLFDGTEVIGAEPQGADDACRSLAAGHIVPMNNPQTIADGLRTSLGERTFPVLRERVSAIVTVSEATIIAAMRRIWERMKIVVEPSAAVALGALLEAPERFAGKRVGLILSGGNVDLDRLPWLK